MRWLRRLLRPSCDQHTWLWSIDNRTGASIESCWFCPATRPYPIPRADELDYVKESNMSKVLSVAARVSKALAASVAAGAAAFSAAEVAGTVDVGEWFTIAAAVLGAFLVAYNAPANTTR